MIFNYTDRKPPIAGWLPPSSLASRGHLYYLTPPMDNCVSPPHGLPSLQSLISIFNLRYRGTWNHVLKQRLAPACVLRSTYFTEHSILLAFNPCSDWTEHLVTKNIPLLFLLNVTFTHDSGRRAVESHSLGPFHAVPLPLGLPD